MNHDSKQQIKKKHLNTLIKSANNPHKEKPIKQSDYYNTQKKTTQKKKKKKNAEKRKKKKNKQRERENDTLMGNVEGAAISN